MYLFTSSKGKVDGNKINRQSASQPRFASTLFHFHPFAFARVLSQSTSLTSTPLLRESERAPPSLRLHSVAQYLMITV